MVPLSLITLALFTRLALTDPVGFGFYVGSGAAIFLAFSVVVPVGSYLVYITSDKGFPVIWGLIAFGALGTLFTDLHHIRVTETPPQARPDLARALVEWHAQAPVVNHPTSGEPVKPMVVVAAAGGGLPAAQWTSTVLGALEDAGLQSGACFHKSLFAVSGVSGGSVGAATYLATLNEASSAKTGNIEAVSRTALSEDFLAPTIVALMFSDILRHFAFPIEYVTDFDDRAHALETAWERQWQTAHAKRAATDGLTIPFSRARQAQDAPDCPNRSGNGNWRPVLLLNGVVQETGQRLIVSHIDFSGDELIDAIDFFDHSATDIPLSTAAHNSARFPYLSPAGTLAPAGLEGHVIDGGYFENFGAATAFDLLKAIARISDQVIGNAPRILPVVVQIGSDTDLEALSLKDPDPMLATRTSRFENELRAPVAGLLATRSARGILAAKRLWRWADDCQTHVERGQSCHASATLAGASFHQFQLTRGISGASPGLGWQLSKRSIRDICMQIRKAPSKPTQYSGNVTNFAHITELLTGTARSPTGQCPP